MKLLTIYENINDLITKIATRDGLEQQEVNNIILSCNPPGGKYADFIAKLWNTNNIRLPEDSTRLKQTLTNFKKYQNKLQVRDINRYKSLHELEEVIDPFVGLSSKRSGGLGFNPLTLLGVNKVSQKGNFYTVTVSDAKSLAKLGEGTKWCTRESYENCAAKQYINRYKYIYILFDNDIPIMQYTPDYFQIMDINDRKVVDDNLLNFVVEPSLTSPREYFYNYALHVIKGRWLKGEPTIFKNNIMTYEYIRDVAKRRIPEAESIIMTSPGTASSYAYTVLKDRWPEAEPIIKTNTYCWQAYCRHFKIG